MFEKVKKGFRRPDMAVEFVMRMTVTRLLRHLVYWHYGPPVNAFEEDWDTLLILDACRYDVFEDTNPLSGNLEARMSPASATLEWLAKTVRGREYHDTVCVAANPRVSRYEENFHKVIPAWDTHWDDDLEVTPPEEVCRLVREALEEYPDKRVVGHFMQPHVPFIGEFGRTQVGTRMAYPMLRSGDFDRETIETAYRENVKVVLSAVEDLIDDLSGRTVVTSDHGEVFGRVGWPQPSRHYGHELYSASIELLKIPWFVHESGQRRSVRRGTSVAPAKDIEDEKIEERLRALGYR